MISTNQPSLFDYRPIIADNKTKFHGKTYDEKKDKKRLNGQVHRVGRVIQSGEWMTSNQLCEKASVSFSALRNRISDLRVYHAFDIESERVNGGLWKYRYNGILSAEEHRKYLFSLKNKKVGDIEKLVPYLKEILETLERDEQQSIAPLSQFHFALRAFLNAQTERNPS